MLTANKSTEELRLSIGKTAGAEKNFPLDKNGMFTLKYRTKTYKFQPYVLINSKYLSSHFNQNSTIKDATADFKCAQSEQALDIVMKLLFGFAEVIVPREEYIQVLGIMYEMGIYKIPYLFTY